MVPCRREEEPVAEEDDGPGVPPRIHRSPLVICACGVAGTVGASWMPKCSSKNLC